MTRTLEDFKQTVARRVRDYRGIADLKQDQLAARAGVGRLQVLRIEAGVVSPKAFTLLLLAEALGVKLDDLTAPDPSTTTT